MHQPFDDNFDKKLDAMTANELRLLWIKLYMKLADEIDFMVEHSDLREANDYLNKFFD